MGHPHDVRPRSGSALPSVPLASSAILQRGATVALPLVILAIPLVPIVLDLPKQFNWLAIAASAILLVPAVWLLLPRPATLIALVITWLSVHKLAAALGGADSSAATLWVSYSKELLTIAVPGVAALALAPGAIRWWRDLPKSGRWSAIRRPFVMADVAAVAFCAIVGVSVLVSDTDLGDRLLAARRLAFGPLLYLAGRMLLPRVRELERGVRAIVILGIAVAAFGLVERLLLGASFWRDVVGIGRYFTTNIDGGLMPEVAKLSDGLPANWITRIGDWRLIRLVSTFLEPTTLGMFLALVLVLVPRVGFRPRVRWLVFGAVGLALLLTWGKAGGLIAVITLVFVAIGASRATAGRVLTAGVILAAVALAIGLILPLNVPAHLAGLRSGIYAALDVPLGRGLGATGYWGDLAKVGLDSSIGTIVAQLGVFGLLAWCIWALFVVWTLLPTRPIGTPAQVLSRTLAGVVFAWFLVGWLSNSTTGLLTTAPIFFLAGWAASAIDRHERPTGPPGGRGLVIGWMPNSRRGRTLADRLSGDLLLLRRPGYRRPWTAPFTYPFLAIRTIQEIVVRQPAWVIVVAPPVLAPLSVLAATIPWRIPCAIDIHSGALLDRRWAWSLPLLRFLARRSGAAIVTLDALAIPLRESGVTVHVVPDPIPDMPEASTAPSRSPSDGDGPLVVAICGWGDDEPIENMLTAVSGEAYRVAVTGQVRKTVTLPSNASLTGFLDEVAYANLLRAADAIVVLTTRRDTLLSGVWEALAVERPVVASDTDAIRATFGSGLTLVGAEPAEIRRGIATVLREPLEAQRRTATIAAQFRIANDAALGELRAWLTVRASQVAAAGAAERAP